MKKSPIFQTLALATVVLAMAACGGTTTPAAANNTAQDTGAGTDATTADDTAKADGTTADDSKTSDVTTAGDATPTDGSVSSDGSGGKDTTAGADAAGGNCPAYAKPATEPGCSSAADKAFVEALKADKNKAGPFADTVRDCTLTHGCMAKGKDCSDEAGTVALQGTCIAKCIVETLDPAVGSPSEKCAWCYGAFTGACGFNHCIGECATDTPECDPCLAKWCDGPADDCKNGK